MVCKTERSIERAATELLQAGWCAGAEESTAPEGLRPFLAHARECVRCRELLEIFLETERWLGEMYGGDERREAPGAGVPGAPPALKERVLALVPLPEVRGHIAGVDGESDVHDLAADTGEPPGGEPPLQLRTLTLVTEDDRYLVRIMPEAGGGARAVLVPFDAGTSGRRSPDPRPALRIGETEYAFDEGGVVELPSFPGEMVLLILR